MRRTKISLFFKKYQRREFRPGYIFDIPLYFYRLYLSLRARSLVFFSNINPGMTLSGFAGHGKYKDLKKFDAHLIPKTIFCTPKDKQENIKKNMNIKGIHFPCIAKPDLGRMGRDITKLHNETDLKNYLAAIDENFLIQEFIDYPIEFGIFYYRIPGEREGHITGIVEKKFMFLEGNGQETFGDLILDHPRAQYYYIHLQKTYIDMRENILPKGELFQLNYIGNHCRWSTFYDKSDLITPELEKVIDKITKKIDGFYFGRYDLKVKNTEGLYKGEVKIMELNGMGSLPTHIYDPDHNIRNAYKTLFKHRSILFRISQANYANGYKYTPFSQALSIIKEYGM